MKKYLPLLLLCACQKELTPSTCYTCTVVTEVQKLNGIISRASSSFEVCNWTADSARAFEAAHTYRDSANLLGWVTVQVTKCQNQSK
jgi:hypothetical protein